MALVITTFLVTNAAAQDADYANWSFSGGTGTFSQPGMPNFTYTVTGEDEYSVDSSEDFDAAAQAATGWDEEFSGNFNTDGDRLNAESLNVVLPDPLANVGDPITGQAVLEVVFDSPTPSAGWGILVLDLDVDQVAMQAFDASRAPIPAATLATWFQDVFDADSSDGTRVPAFDPAPGIADAVAIVGNLDGDDSWHDNHVDASDDDAGAGWFLPTLSVSRLVFRFEDWDSDNASSFHVFIAANSSAPVELMSFSVE